MKKSVGIIGLGIMGEAMAANLAERGWTVIGYDSDPQRATDLAAANVVQAVADARTLAHSSEVIVTSLPTPEALASVAREIAASGAPKRIVVETSTMSLDDKLSFAKVLNAAGHTALDCPLSGTGAQAKSRDLVVYASGDSAAIAEVTPLFNDFAKQSADLGAFGNGSRMKFVANLLVAIHNVAAAEAMVLAMKAGLDLDQVVNLVGPGAGGSRMFQLRAPMMAKDQYEPATMRISTWRKDMSIIASFAQGLGVRTPVFSSTAPLYEEAMAAGLGEMDTASVCKVLQTMAGIAR